MIGVSMSDASTFTGIIGFFGNGSGSGNYGNGSGVCGLSSATLPANLVLAKTLPAGSSTQHCTVIATQGTNSATADIAISVVGPTPTVTFSVSPVSVGSTTPAFSVLSGVRVTMSDGSLFAGSLAFGGTYGSGSGACGLDALTAPTNNTMADTQGVWGFGSGPPTQYGYPILLNNALTDGTAALLVSYNGHTYAQTSPTPGWYLWTGVPGADFVSVSGDPRPAGTSAINLGKSLLGSPSLQHCSVTATP
jgi:hypothetical protein